MKTSISEQSEINGSYENLASQQGLLPIKVTPFYQKKIDEEVKALGHTEGPLHRAAYPTNERLNVKIPGEVADFVDDRKNMPPNLHHTAIRKYKERMLFIPSSDCFGHCQYCFRTDVLSEQGKSEMRSLEEKLEAFVQYLNEHPEIEEVILTGGDPMTLGHKKLEEILLRLRQDTEVESIRIHTRSLIYSPQIFNEDMARMLGENKVRLASHIIHPYEICDEVISHLEAIQKHGVRCYNQFPVLRGINDHAEVLIKHLKKLDELNIRNLSIFIPDPIKFSASFRVRMARLLNMIDEVNHNSAAWINSTRLVLDTYHGKVRREDIKDYDCNKGTVIFEREGQKIEYPDIPASVDRPGDIKTMLWKDKI